MQKKYPSQVLKNLVVLSCCLLISCGGGDDGIPLDEGTEDVAPPHVPMNGGPCATDADCPEGGLCQISGFSARSFCSYECDYVNDICHLQDLAGGDAFDLAELGLSTARFVRIIDSGTSDYTGTSGGFDLDALAVVHWPDQQP